MTSRGLGLTDRLAQDMQEELDFSDLFLYNPPEDFSDGCDKGMCVCVQHFFFSALENNYMIMRWLSVVFHAVKMVDVC